MSEELIFYNFVRFYNVCALFLQQGEKMKRITIKFFVFIRLPPHPQIQRQVCYVCNYSA